MRPAAAQGAGQEVGRGTGGGASQACSADGMCSSTNCAAPVRPLERNVHPRPVHLRPVNCRPICYPAGVDSRIEALTDRLVGLLHTRTCRSLLNTHRLPALLHLARALRPGAFPPDEWHALLDGIGGYGSGGGAGPARAAGCAAPPPAWLPAERGAAYAALVAAVPGVEAAAQLHDAGTWAPWLAAAGGGGGGSGDGVGGAAPWLPARVAGRLGGLQGLLVVKALCPERLQAALARWGPAGG